MLRYLARRCRPDVMLGLLVKAASGVASLSSCRCLQRRFRVV